MTTVRLLIATLLLAVWFSGTTPGEIIGRRPHASVVVSTGGNGGTTWSPLEDPAIQYTPPRCFIGRQPMAPC